MAIGKTLVDLQFPDLLVPYLTPKDVVNLCECCKELRSALDVDSVWEQFIPKSTAKVVKLNDNQATTKKEIYTNLCKPFLLGDTGTQAYWLDPPTGGVCYSLAARGLGISSGNDPGFWKWTFRDRAMWPGLETVAYLERVSGFSVTGTIKCFLPQGAYTFSWRIQCNLRDSYCWTDVPVTFRVSMADGSQATTSHRYLTNALSKSENMLDDHHLIPVRLVDGRWLEFDAGEITVTDEENETSLEFSMKELAGGGRPKWGLALDGVVLRPTSLTKAAGSIVNINLLL